MTTIGLSFYLSLLITAEIGEIDRFDRAEEVVTHARLDPVFRKSGGSRIEGGISKWGSGDLCYILVQCANVAVNRCNDPYPG
jgi:transposase